MTLPKIRLERGVPALVAGTLLLFSTAPILPARAASPLHPSPSPVSRPSTFAAELAAEGDWRTTRREALRAVHADGAAPEARLLQAVAALRLHTEIMSALDTLEALADDDRLPPGLRAEAALERGRSLAARRDPNPAFEALRFAFATADDPALFRRAADALRRFLRDHPAYARPEIRSQLAATTVDGARARRDPATPRAPGPIGRAGARIARGGAAFYRANISPAIGSRCSLHPSCSQYFIEVTRRYGWLGFAIYGHRSVHEPTLIAAGEPRVRHGDAWRISDPPPGPDHWLNRDRERRK